MLFIIIIKQEIFHIDDTDYVIRALLINRKTCKFILAENIDQFIIGRVCLDKSHIDTRDHNFFCLRIAEIKYVMDHVPFFMFDDTAFLADINDGTEFFFGHKLRRCVRIYMKQKQNSHG